MDFRQVEALGDGERFSVNLRAADHEDFIAVHLAALQGVVQGAGGDAGVRIEASLAADDDIAPPWQGATEGFVGFATHDDRVPQSEGLEVLEVLWQAPGHGVVVADDAVGGHCRNQ